MHTFLGVADADTNLEFFGLGDLPDRTAPGVKYTIAARGSVKDSSSGTPFCLRLAISGSGARAWSARPAGVPLDDIEVEMVAHVFVRGIASRRELPRRVGA